MSPAFLPYVAGAFMETGEVEEVRSPYDGRLLSEVHLCTPAELDQALAGAAEAMPRARALSSQERAAILCHIASQLLARRDEIALNLCDESGKPISDARGEVDRAVHCFELSAAEAGRAAREGQLIPMDVRAPGVGRLGLTTRVPRGPVLAITPFNFPLNLAAHKVAPAMAAGCPIVLKPAEQTPTTALLLAQIIDETSWPRGALSVVPARREVAERLVADERPRVLSFTGSQGVGWALKARAGKKRVLLELGGNAAVIIDDTVRRGDLDGIIPKLIYGAFSYAGQKCISIQRIYVVDGGGGLYEEIRERLVGATAALCIGDPRDEEVMVGPMIDERNARRVKEWIDEAVALGARLLCGGTRRGSVVEPTLLEGVPAHARAHREEIFGPVANLYRAASFAEATSAVNDSAFGLQAALFTRDLGNSLAAFSELEVGAVILNEAPSFRIDHMPYGGVKDSGLGREGIRCAIEEMTELRLLVTGALPG